MGHKALSEQPGECWPILLIKVYEIKGPVDLAVVRAFEFVHNPPVNGLADYLVERDELLVTSQCFSLH